MDERTTAISAIADDVADTIERHNDLVENAIVALAIVVSRLIYGVGDIEGTQSQEAARRLLDDSIDSTMHVLRARYPSSIRPAGHC